MATKFVTNIDLNQNQLLNGKFESLASDPGSGNFEGRLIYNSTEKVLKVYTGSAWRKAIHAATSTTNALVVSESNGTVSFSIANVVAGGDSGLLTGADKTKLDNATSTNTNSTLAIRDGSGRIQVSTPSADLDAANKAYVDAARTGLDVKASVRAATTAALTLASGLENGDTLDGVTLATGDRVLVKDQGTGSENGIYIVAASGAPSRATDADANSEMTPGMFTFVEEGTTNADSGWVMTNDGAITVGTTALTFALFSVAGTIFAGDGLSKTGDTLNVNVKSDGGLQITSDDVEIKLDSGTTGLETTSSGLALTTVAITEGGTNATTEAAARDNLAATSASGLTTSTPTTARIASDTIGDGSATSYVITHNLGTRAVVIQVYDAASYDTVIADVVRTSTDTATITFASAPASNAYVAVITG
jgi:hypothetical protein